MYFVNLFDENYSLISSAPFEDKNQAIEYFNLRCDGNCLPFANFKFIEIYKDQDLLFDYEF